MKKIFIFLFFITVNKFNISFASFGEPWDEVETGEGYTLFTGGEEFIINGSIEKALEDYLKNGKCKILFDNDDILEMKPDILYRIVKAKIYSIVNKINTKISSNNQKIVLIRDNKSKSNNKYYLTLLEKLYLEENNKLKKFKKNIEHEYINKIAKFQYLIEQQDNPCNCFDSDMQKDYIKTLLNAKNKYDDNNAIIKEYENLINKYQEKIDNLEDIEDSDIFIID